ncbi:hypothetical protein Lepto7376_1174 [[Leptolyngbya] sp. PCC 7376]|nr:hypothetical protein Lepto7376_1174 [[Leptolyngbya] sp. PCC 7376]
MTPLERFSNPFFLRKAYSLNRIAGNAAILEDIAAEIIFTQPLHEPDCFDS